MLKFGTIYREELIPSSVFIPPDRMPIVEFCERYRHLSARYTASEQLWQVASVPYARFVLECFCDPSVEKITLVWASQTTKTATLENMLFYSVCHAPQPALWIMPNEKLMISLIQERLRPTIESSPRIAAELCSGARGITHNRLNFQRMPVFFGLADSEADLSSRPCGYVIMDEIDKFPMSTTREGSPVDQAIARTRTFPRRKIVMSSTPTNYQGKIWKTLQASTRWAWCVQDPGSGEFVPWEWKRVRWDAPEKYAAHTDLLARAIEDEEVPVWYEFPSGARIFTRAEKNALNSSGRWVCVAQGEKNHFGFQLPSLASIWSDFRKMAARWVRARALQKRGDNREIQIFINHELAEPFQPKRAEIGEGSLLHLVRRDCLSGHFPDGYQYWTMGVDVQRGGIYWQAVAFNNLDRRAHVIEFGAASGGVEEWIPKLASKNYGGKPPLFLFVDAGEGMTAPEVYRACLRLPQFARPIHGLAQTQTKGRYLLTSQDVKAAHRGRLVLIAVNLVKDALYAALQNQQITFCDAVERDEEYRYQMAAEERVSKPGQRGQTVSFWRVREGFTDNHYFDAMVYALAGGIAAGWIKSARAARVYAHQEQGVDGDEKNQVEQGKSQHQEFRKPRGPVPQSTRRISIGMSRRGER